MEMDSVEDENDVEEDEDVEDGDEGDLAVRTIERQVLDGS